MLRRCNASFERHFPFFDSVFDHRVYRESTLIRKRCHLNLYLGFIWNTQYGDNTVVDFSTYLRNNSPTDILASLKEWAAQLALSGLTLQTLRNYVESNYTYICWAKPTVGVLTHCWGQAWMQVKMGVGVQDVKQAPIYDIRKHTTLTVLGKLAAILLYTGSLRFHALHDKINFITWGPDFVM